MASHFVPLKTAVPCSTVPSLNSLPSSCSHGEGDVSVVAPHFPKKKMVNWWLIVGEQSTRQLLSIKGVTISKNLSIKLEFTLPKGTHALKLYAICDLYIGADHNFFLNPNLYTTAHATKVQRQSQDM